MDGDLEKAIITCYGIHKWEMKQNSVSFNYLTPLSYIFN